MSFLPIYTTTIRLCFQNDPLWKSSSKTIEMLRHFHVNGRCKCIQKVMDTGKMFPCKQGLRHQHRMVWSHWIKILANDCMFGWLQKSGAKASYSQYTVKIIVCIEAADRLWTFLLRRCHMCGNKRDHALTKVWAILISCAQFKVLTTASSVSVGLFSSLGISSPPWTWL